MKFLLKRIIVLEMEIMANESNPTHFQTTQHVLNEYTPEKYKELFAKLQVVERTYADMKQLIGDFKEVK